VTTTTAAADKNNDRPIRVAVRADPPRLTRHEWWVLAALVAFALVLTMVDLGSRSLWVDELHTAFVATARGRSLWDSSTYDDGNMLAYYAFMNLWVHLFGTSPVALRLPSALAGAVLVPVGYLLGRRSGGMRSGVAAALLLAVSPPLVVWAQQGRGYSIAVVGIGLTWLALVRARAVPSTSRLILFVVLRGSANRRHCR
jgi:mannosyltransferase